MRRDDPDIILLVLDSLRRDRLSCYGYDRPSTPTIDELAAKGIRFEDAYATGPWTVPVHGSLFTGKRPTESGVHRRNKHLTVSPDKTLAGVLSVEGYDTVGFSANPWVNGEFGFDTGFDDFHDVTPKPPFEDAGDPRSHDWEANGGLPSVKEYLSWMFDGNPAKRLTNGLYFKKFFDYPLAEADHVNERILSWFDEKESRNPSFVFANYMDVHEPYRLREEHLPRDSTLDESQFQNPDNVNLIPRPERPEAVDELYDAALSYLDSKLDELLGGLRKGGNLENTILVLVGDHGQCFGEHDYWGHGTFLFDELIQVPLVVVPFCEETPDVDPSRPVSVADVPRFVSSIAGVAFDDVESHSFVPGTEVEPVVAESRGPRPKLRESTTASEEGYRAVYHEGWKLVRNFDTGEVEFENATTVPDDIRDELLEFETELGDDLSVEVDDRTISEEREKMLRELGYL